MNNRIYKFRAWDKEERKWKLGYKELGGFHLLGELNLLGEVNAELASPLSKLQDIEIMQYTGLKDKNDKEIYEGDIIFAKMMSISPIGTYVKVVFDKGSFQVEDKKGDRCWNDYLIMINGEVIGNVYENPELYEENK